jgi:uncharacterized protein
VDITPASPAGRQIIEGYGPGRFRIGGRVFEGSVTVLPNRAAPWPIQRIDDLSVESLSDVLDAAGEIEFLLIGCGAHGAFIPPRLRQDLRDRGLVIEAMDTGAACRTFNVLMGEGRPVAAALIAIA